MKKQKSEFGKGFTYCLGLFLCHAEREYAIADKDKGDPNLWLYCAADHLYEFQTNKAPKPIREGCVEFKRFILEHRLGKSLTWNDINGLIKTAKKILLEYDKLCGFKVAEATWE